jgi:hypothetical protein
LFLAEKKSILKLGRGNSNLKKEETVGACILKIFPLKYTLAIS